MLVTVTENGLTELYPSALGAKLNWLALSDIGTVVACANGLIVTVLTVPENAEAVALRRTSYVPGVRPVTTVPVIAVQVDAVLSLYSIAAETFVIVPLLLALVVQCVELTDEEVVGRAGIWRFCASLSDVVVPLPARTMLKVVPNQADWI